MQPETQPDLEARVLAWAQKKGSAPNIDGADDELRWLAAAMGHPEAAAGRPDPPAFIEGQPIRAGYRLIAETSGRPRVVPAFAQALAAGISPQERWLFEHLWGVDLALWRERNGGDFAHLASLWLQSPGRRLVREPTILRQFHRQDKQPECDGATDLRLPALWGASGADEVECGDDDNSPGATRWRDLHCAIPGERMARWWPKRSDHSVVVAFSRLERGSPYCLRGAAIGWLLSQAVDRPITEIGGVRQDLREVLPGRLAVAMQLDEEMADENFTARFEEATLQHAALIASRGDAPGRVRRAWHVARWIHGCLVRSPFVKDDDERLRAELLALLPSESPTVDVDDPLHPARFGTGGLRIEDVAMVAGIWAHYGREGERLTPTPLPLVQAVRRLAGRPLTEGERAAEDSLARGASNELGWTAPHVAPPWVARWLLTEWRIAWLSQASDAVIEECLEALRADARFEWFAYVWRSEGAALAEPLQDRALAVWREACARRHMTGQALASMAVGLIARLGDRDRALAFWAAMQATEVWQPFLFDAWAEAALRTKKLLLAEPALAQLLAVTRADERAVEVRLNAALLLLRRAASVRETEIGARYLRELADLAAGSPFSEHTGLLRELRRLGAAGKMTGV